MVDPPPLQRRCLKSLGVSKKVEGVTKKVGGVRTPDPSSGCALDWTDFNIT